MLHVCIFNPKFLPATNVFSPFHSYNQFILTGHIFPRPSCYMDCNFSASLGVRVTGPEKEAYTLCTRPLFLSLVDEMVPCAWNKGTQCIVMFNCHMYSHCSRGAFAGSVVRLSECPAIFIRGEWQKKIVSHLCRFKTLGMKKGKPTIPANLCCDPPPPAHALDPLPTAPRGLGPGTKVDCTAPPRYAHPFTPSAPPPPSSFQEIMALGANVTAEELAQIMSRRIRAEKVANKDTKLRTFINDDSTRDAMVGHVYDVTAGAVTPEDSLIIIDDSIVRGTTLKKSVLGNLGRLNPKRIVFISSAPQIRYPDCYGIDMAKLGDLCAFKAAIDLLKETGQEHTIHEVLLSRPQGVWGRNPREFDVAIFL